MVNNKTNLWFADDVTLTISMVKDMETLLVLYNHNKESLGLKMHKGRTILTNFKTDETIKVEDQEIELRNTNIWTKNLS